MTEWVTNEVLITGSYLSDHPPGELKLTCLSVSLIPGQFSETTGADGSILQSVTKSESLLVEGVDAARLDAEGWQPQVVAFSDLNTGVQVAFNVRRVRITGPSTAAFDIG